MKRFYWIIFTLLLYSCSALFAQSKEVTLDLSETIALANDSSLSAFKAKNIYVSGYWAYRTFRAERLPSLTLYSVPLRYNRDITRRYDSNQNIDIFRPQQSLFSHINLSAQQNFDLTGGTFFVDTELGFIHNFGDQTGKQFTSVPIRLGYRQELIGYNRFKWEKKIEPLKFQRAQKELVANMQATAELASEYFFDLALAQAEYELARENKSNSQRLYEIGEEKFKIASIGQSDLLTLKLDKVNAQNSFKNAEIRLNRAMFALAAFLKLDKDTQINLHLPNVPQEISLNSEEAVQRAKENNPQYLEHKQKTLESLQVLERTRLESLFNIGISASVGFNQIAPTFQEVYRSPLRQDIVAITLSIPLVDWGVRKGRYNMAKSNYNITKLSTSEMEVRLEEEVIMTVGDFEVQQQMIKSAEEAMQLAKLAYEQTEERFIIGKADINSLTLSTNRRQQALRNYIYALRSYWQSYFKLRKLTLYDFANNCPLEIDDEIMMNN